ncbi:glycosyltransferase family 9 protein [Candidatus Omnitrophota bacterium]
MKMKQMRYIDKYVGTVLCALLTVSYKLFAKISGNNKNNNIPDQVNRILMVKFWGMGSIMLASCAVRAVRERYPKAKIYFLTFAKNREVCESLGMIDQIVALDPSSFWRFAFNAIKTLHYLRSLKLDLAMDLEFLARFSAIMTYLSGARKTAEFHSNILWRGDFSKIKVSYNCYYHLTENFLNLVRLLGIQERTKDLVRPQVEQKVREKIGGILKENRIGTGEMLLGVNINSNVMALERRWPKQNFAALLNRLLDEYSIKVVLIGGKEDRNYVDGFANSLIHKEKVANLAGKISIKELIALLEHCALFISNDSGPLHIACALDIPTVSFFGPETPTLYGPQGQKHLVHFNSLLCSPCMNIHNNKLVTCLMNNKCMTDISVDQVHASIKEKYGDILENRKS